MDVNKITNNTSKTDSTKIFKNILALQKSEEELYKGLDKFSISVENKIAYDETLRESKRVSVERKRMLSDLYGSFESETIDRNKSTSDIADMKKAEQSIHRQLESFSDSLKTKPEYEVIVKDIVKISNERYDLLNKLDSSGEDTKKEQDKILDDISNLQNLESKLYNTLESSATTNNPDYDDTIKEINKTTDERNQMFNELNKSFKNKKSYNDYKKSELSDKLSLVQVMEEDLNNKKRMLNSLATNKADKMRMVEINTYYSSKYSAQTEIMKMIIIICVPLLIITILSKKEIIPENIADIVMALVITIGAGIVAVKFYDLTIRNNMNFEEYEWGSDPSSLPATTDTTTSTSTQNSSNNLFDNVLNFGCVGEKCCSKGMYYDVGKEQCLTGSRPISLTEGFAPLLEDSGKLDEKKYSIVVPFNITQTDYFYVND